MLAETPGPGPEQWRNELRVALDDQALSISDRQRRLLEFVATEEIEGRGARLKAYVIAIEVLGRRDDFDPQLDSIVRVEVGRLRRALELYYALSTRRPEVEITIPKGAYRPVFTTAAARAETEPGSGADSAGQPLSTRAIPERRWSSSRMVAVCLGLAALSGLTASTLYITGMWPMQTAEPRLQTGSSATAASRPELIVIPMRFESEGQQNLIASHLLHLRLTEHIARRLPGYVVTSNDRADNKGDIDLVLRTAVQLVDKGAVVSFILIDANMADVVTKGFFRVDAPADPGPEISRGIIEGVSRQVVGALVTRGIPDI